MDSLTPDTELTLATGSVELPSVSPSCSAASAFEGPCPVCPYLAERFEPYRQAAYWRSMHERALQREAALRQENDSLRAQLRLREQQLFGTKSEAHPAKSEASAPTNPPARRPRGQQRGRPSPKRRDHSDLPAIEEVLELSPERQCCPCCGLPFEPFPGTEDGEILEVDVRAYRRVYRRRRYKPTCVCEGNPGIVTAAPPPKLIPKSTLGVSIWVEVLLDKYLFYRPSYRLLADWETLGLDLSLGTLTDGLKRLTSLFEPLYQACVEHNQGQKHWHADETRWLVYASVEGKVGHRWVLWVFHSEEAVVFVLDSGRAHDVPEVFLGPVEEGILSVDRYGAYKAMEQVKDGTILLAFCWAHVRRDFLGVAKSWPSEEGWAMGWVEQIGALYQHNRDRLAAWEQPGQYAWRQERLRDQLERMRERMEEELAQEPLHPARRGPLASLKEHWQGLTVFLEHPEVPLDNNQAERALRGPVVGRKNYRGSGSTWSGELAAMLFSLFQTLCLWKLNPRAWLGAYLRECAAAGGKIPEDPERFLPWRMSEQQFREFSMEEEPASQDSS